MIFETHAHYDDKQFDSDREELLQELPKEGIGYVVNIGANLATSYQTISLTKKYDYIYGAVGVHPNDVEELDEKKLNEIKDMCMANKKVVAIGEIGLDYYWPEPSHELQQHWFIEQIKLAKQVGLPIVVHSRDAAKDTMDILKREDASSVGGIMHCFSYSKEIAKEVLDMGLFLGIGGVITFSNAKKLIEVVEYTPLEKIVLETDCPYLAPVPNRGKRNSSLNLKYVIEKIAEIKAVSCEEVMEVTNRNGKEAYGITG